MLVRVEGRQDYAAHPPLSSAQVRFMPENSRGQPVDNLPSIGIDSPSSRVDLAQNNSFFVDF